MNIRKIQGVSEAEGCVWRRSSPWPWSALGRDYGQSVETIAHPEPETDVVGQ